MNVEVPSTCGNAPRHQIITEVLAAIYRKDLPALEQWLSPDVRWIVAGIQPLDGLDAVREWILAIPETRTVQFLSVLTHGAEGSADGQSYDANNSVTRFSHVLRFASAGKTAKIKQIRSYFVQQ